MSERFDGMKIYKYMVAAGPVFQIHGNQIYEAGKPLSQFMRYAVIEFTRLEARHSRYTISKGTAFTST
jgi:hypothetical protein